MSMPTADLHPKLECDVQNAPIINSLGDVASHMSGTRTMSVEEDMDDNLFDDQTHGINTNINYSVSGENSPTVISSSIQIPNPVEDKNTTNPRQNHGKTHVGFSEPDGLPFPPINNSSNGMHANTISNTGNNNSNTTLPHIGNNGSNTNLNASANSMNSTTNSSRKPITLRKAPNEQKKIKALVAVIKQVKDGNGGIDDVLKKWGTLSRF